MLYSLSLGHLELQFPLKEILLKSMASSRLRYHLSCLRVTELCEVSLIGLNPDVILQKTLDALLDLIMTEWEQSKDE